MDEIRDVTKLTMDELREATRDRIGRTSPEVIRLDGTLHHIKAVKVL